ncbi:hypothetical protein NHQ30_007196 [Ciborinia camelliae]|nr:hypothetical protein NHQ30_007196 [Ciborinia camelliae]
MAMLPSSLLLLIYAFSTCVNAELSIPSQVTSFIPTCAQVCFESFIQDNFPASVCGDTPTLNCLCENGSKSTYTVGEGAVQCIISEASVGFCNGDDSSNDTVLKAYDMCESDKSALPNTHSTLTATLVFQPGSSIVQIAPVVTTSASGSVATTLRTTAPIATPSSTTNSKSSTRATETAAATVAPSPEKSKPVLSTAQIAGIVVAGVGVVVLAVGAILLFACMRRKRQANRDSGYLPFQQEPSMSIKSPSHFGITKPMVPSPASISTRGPTPIGPFLGARIAPRTPPRGNQPSPDTFSQRNAIPENIGLAMTSESPQNNLLTPMAYTEDVFQRGPSPLLPERPALTLQVPFQQNSNNIHTGAYQQPSNLAVNNRQSMVTQFEDEDLCSTAVASEAPWNAASFGPMPHEKVPRQPDPAYYQSPRFQGELSPNETETIINSYQDFSVEPDLYVRPLNLQRNVSQSLRPENAIKPPVSRNRSVKDSLTASSSAYSAKSRTRRPPSVEVDRLNSLMQSNPSFRRVGKSAYNPAGPYDQNRTSSASVGSMTSFETIDSINPEPQELSEETNLSPVVESPSGNQNGSGKSPAKYPKIKGNMSQRHSRTRTRTAAPPIFIESPIRPPTAHSKNPWQEAEIEAEIAAQRMRMSSLGLSPGSHNSAITIRKSGDFFSPTALASRNPSPPIPLPLPPTTRQRDISPGGMSGGRGKRNAPPPSLSLSSSSPSNPNGATKSSQNSRWRVVPDNNTNTRDQEPSAPIALASPHWRPQVFTGILRKDSAQSLFSSPNKSITNTNPQNPEVHISPIPNPETRNHTFNPHLTQMPTISDMKAQGRITPPSNPPSNPTSRSTSTSTFTSATKPIIYSLPDGSGQMITIHDDGDTSIYNENENDTYNENENENENDNADGGLPKTPGWLPKLTPTRRGNDLFLKVQ